MILTKENVAAQAFAEHIEEAGQERLEMGSGGGGEGAIGDVGGEKGGGGGCGAGCRALELPPSITSKIGRLVGYMELKKQNQQNHIRRDL